MAEDKLKGAENEMIADAGADEVVDTEVSEVADVDSYYGENEDGDSDLDLSFLNDAKEGK